MLADHLLAVIRRPAGDEWAGMPPSRLHQEAGARILMRAAAGETRYSVCRDDTPCAAEDRVLALTWRPLVPET